MGFKSEVFQNIESRCVACIAGCFKINRLVNEIGFQMMDVNASFQERSITKRKRVVVIKMHKTGSASLPLVFARQREIKRVSLR